jgi:hypothetical protein
MILIEGLNIETRLRDVLLEFAQSDVVKSDAEFERVLRMLKSYLAFAREMSLVNPPLLERELVETACMEYRRILETYLITHSVSGKIAKKIRSLIDNLPNHVTELEGYEFSSWVAFSHDHVWRKNLGSFIGKPDLRFLEVGSFEGRSSCWLLQNILTEKSAKLICIDLFDSSDPNLDYERAFDKNIRMTGQSHKVQKIKGRSQKILSTLIPNSFDFIYLDASSDEKDELEDACLSWGLLKKNGILTFDDYGGPLEWEPGVKKGIDLFLSQFHDRCEILDRAFQLTIRKCND